MNDYSNVYFTNLLNIFDLKTSEIYTDTFTNF